MHTGLGLLIQASIATAGGVFIYLLIAWFVRSEPLFALIAALKQRYTHRA